MCLQVIIHKKKRRVRHKNISFVYFQIEEREGEKDGEYARVYVYVCARAYDGWRARRWHACATPVVLCGREAKLRGYVIRRVSSERGCRRSSAFGRVRPWRAEETTWYAWHFDVRFSIARASFEINFTRLCYVLANEFVRVAFRGKASSTRREIIINRSFRRNSKCDLRVVICREELLLIPRPRSQVRVSVRWYVQEEAGQAAISQT